jgi:NDP-sugar pyrophosphorylase family protein
MLSTITDNPQYITNMQAVILAAGKGSRLLPITNSRSKPMLPILGKPIVERVMQNLAACGLSDFILVVNPEDREIREYFQDESRLDVNLHFVDQSLQLGTAHALMQAAPLLSADFVLSACDTLVSEEDLQRLLSIWTQQPGLQGLLSLIRIPIAEASKTGIVTLEEDRVTSIVEKPAPDQALTDISSLPLYCFSPRLLDFLPQVQLSSRGEYELQDALQMLIAQGGDVRGLFFQSKHSLTSVEDLLEINLHFLQKDDGNWMITPQAVGPNTSLVTPLYIEKGTIIGSDCNIGPNVYVERDAHIGNRVRLKNVVVLRKADIPDEANLSHQVVTA